MNNKFVFYENFKITADKLPDELRLKFYDALTNYAFKQEESDDPVVSALITALKPSLDKVENRGGNHNHSGQNQYSEVKSGQKEVKNAQSGQSFLKNIKDIKDIKNIKDNYIYVQNDPNIEKFEAFWREYIPVECDGRVVGKGSKQEAEKKFLKILKEGEDYENIMRGLRNYLQFCRRNNQLTCGATVFLNQKRWADDYNTTTISSDGNKGQRQEPSSIVETYAQIAAEYGDKK